MSPEKLNSIIAEKNALLERQTVNRASQIIDEIAENQQAILEANANIEILRKELTDLTVPQINPVSILG